MIVCTCMSLFLTSDNPEEYDNDFIKGFHFTFSFAISIAIIPVIVYIYKFAADLKFIPLFLNKYTYFIYFAAIIATLNFVYSLFDGSAWKTNIRRFWAIVLSLNVLMIFIHFTVMLLFNILLKIIIKVFNSFRQRLFGYNQS